MEITQERLQELIDDILSFDTITEDKPRFWMLQGYSFKNDGKFLYVEQSHDKTKELVWNKIDPEAFKQFKITTI